MCRIFGVVSTNIQNDVFLSWIKSTDTLLSNGGPDDSGIVSCTEPSFILGHRRLSILDTTSAGHQPMQDKSQSLIVSFNGEIYNYLEIKASLIQLGHKFITHTDTEIILYAYKEWGEKSFEKFNGMFAFGLMDKSNNLFYLVRDRMGMKPLYYYNQNGVLAFASEVKAFYNFAYPIDENPDWKIYFLAFGHVPEPYSTLKNVLMLPKGNFLKYNIQSNTTSLKSYASGSYTQSIHNKKDAEEQIRVSLTNSVKRHLISDVPVGVFLSGGIDSSLIALVAASQSKAKNINTISINFDDQAFNERIFQKIIVEKIGSTHHDYTIDKQTFIQNLPSILSAYDQPSVDGINTWFISRYAKELGLKVVLSGLGADEQLGGYPSFKPNYALNLLNILPKQFFASFKYFDDFRFKKLEYLAIKDTLSKYLVTRSNFSPSVISKLLGINESVIFEKLEEFNFNHIAKDFDTFEQVSWFETNLYMQNQLLKDSDNLSMQHGVEIRLPFLDNEFVQTIQSIDRSLKSNQKSPKELLVNSFADILPQEIYQRTKKGFSFPLANWMQHQDVLSLISQNTEACKLADQFKNGNMEWSRLWSLVLMEKFESES